VNALHYINHLYSHFVLAAPITEHILVAGRLSLTSSPTSASVPRFRFMDFDTTSQDWPLESHQQPLRDRALSEPLDTCTTSGTQPSGLPDHALNHFSDAW
jgi:hypothetical protein